MFSGPQVNDTLLSETESVCPECLERIPARRVACGESVYLDKTCPEHGYFRAVVWRGEPDYTSWLRPKIPKHPETPFTGVQSGCPFDCGLCPEHRQQTCTALLEVTSRCDLGCPFCFADSRVSTGRDARPDPSLQTIEMWYRRLLEAGGPYNVQLSGGEPTMRDDLDQIISLGCSLGFDFIQLNTNGLRLGQDANFAHRLKDAGLSSIFLQFDGTSDAVYRSTRGRPLLAQKMAVIERCAELDMGVVLVPTLIPGANTHQIGDIIRFALEYVPTVRGVHFQPVSYFGRYPVPAARGGQQFRPVEYLPSPADGGQHVRPTIDIGQPSDTARITIPEVIRAIEEQTDGAVSRENFRPPGCENAFCSFHGNFLLMPGGKLQPLTRHESGCCSPQPERAELGAAKAIDFVARSWAAPPDGWDGHDLDSWDGLIRRLRTHTLGISGMAFQDAWTLDLERLRDCCIHTVSSKGKIIPFCAYNLTDRCGRALYRRNVHQWAVKP